MMKRLLAMLLVVILVASTCSTAFAIEIKDGNDDGKINLVTLGASNTNGYGIRGYLPASVTEDPLAADKSKLNVYGYERAPETAYPAQVAAMLEETTGEDVKLNQLAISSMRVEEVRMLLDENYYGDAYTAWRFYNENGDGWFAQAESQGTNSGEEALANLRSAYQNAITNADVITMDMGLNNFGVFAFNNIKANLADGRFWKAPDFSQIMDVNEQICYEEIKATVMDLLTSNVDNIDPSLLHKLELMADTLTYAAIGYCYNFDIVMEKIYDMNPDVNVVVVSIQNMLHGVNIEFESILLPMGDLYGELIDLVNIYTASGSPYADRYVFAHVGEKGHATTFLDEILAWDGDPETLTDNMKDCFDMYDDGLYIRSVIEYIMVAPILLDQPLPAIVQDMIHSGNMDLDSVMESNDMELLMYLYNASQALKEFRAQKGENLGELGVAVYNVYNNALNTAYGIVATVVQEVLQNDTIEVDADSLSGFGSKEDVLMGYIFGEALKGAQTTFEASFADPGYVYDGFAMDEELLADPAVKAIAVLSGRFNLGNSFYAHLNEDGHDEVTDAIMEALEKDISGDEFTEEKLIQYAEALAELISEYYDEAYAYAYDHAAEEGYIDDTVAGIDAAIEALENVDLSGTEMTPEFQAKAAEEIAEIIETLEAAKALILEADVLDQDALNALQALLDEAAGAAARLEELLRQAEDDSDKQAILSALQEANRILTEDIIPQAVEQLKAAVQAGTQWLREQIAEAYDAFVNEFLPEADAWMYDWLYNNPDKVIAFFNKYGDEMLKLADEYSQDVIGIMSYLAYTYGDDVVAYVLDHPEETLSNFVEWYREYGYRIWPMIDVYLEELGTIEKIEKALEKLGIEINQEIQNKINEIKAMISGEIDATIEEIEKAIDELIAMIEEMLYDATHGEYTVTAGSYYVAIDELYAEGEGYADKLAAELGIAYTEINELDEAEIAKADLITVRYNNEPMIAAMIEDAKDYKKVEPKDWSVYVGEEGCEYVQQALAEVEAMLAEQGMDELSEMAVVAVASYAYEYVAHLIEYVQVLETIAEINPDALVISVGMNNALADVVLTMGEDEIALGEYVQYVVDAANLEAFAYVLVTGNAIYVDAPAVETEFDAEEAADVMDFILNLIDEESREVLLATDAGHEYIKEQILGALTITYEGLLGDANNDGVVDYVDAIYVLEYDAKLRAADELALHLCDVNGDGAVDYVDAIFILEYDAKLITKFPAAA